MSYIGNQDFPIDPCNRNSSDSNAAPASAYEAISLVKSYLENLAASIYSKGQIKSDTNDENYHKNILEILKSIVNARQFRTKIFDSDIFEDPAWNILLDLAIVRLENKIVSISSLCVAAEVPTTTAIRWIRHLESLNLICIADDIHDRRRRLVSISDETFLKMLRFAEGFMQ
jgi:hypothetical protein